MGVVHVSEHHTSDQSLTRSLEHSSRQKISNTVGQKGLAITPQYLPEDQSEIGQWTCLIHQLQEYFSWRPDPYAKATDAFLQTWSGKICYANPPWGLMLKILSGISQQQADVIIVAPVWKAQAWYPILLSLLFDYPHLFPSGQHPCCFILTTTSLSTTGSTTSCMAYLRGYCQTEKLSEAASTLLMALWREKSNKSYNSLFHKWDAGVLHGTEILFQALCHRCF